MSLLDIQIKIKISIPESPMLYVLQSNKSNCVLCSLSSTFYFIGDKIDADCFKYKITPLLKENDRLKFAQECGIES